MTNIMGLLTIARRAGKLALGLELAKDACKVGNAKCVCVADDISKKSFKEMMFFCTNAEIPVLYLGMNMEEVGIELGRKVGVIAVLDSGFAKKAATLLNKASSLDAND